MRLSARQIESFFSQGYLYPIDAIGEQEAALLSESVRRYEGIIDGSGSDYLKMHRHFPKLHLLATWADRLVHEPQILNAVESLIGPDILAWSSGLFIRRAGSRVGLAWHQDIAYFGLDNYNLAVRVWIGLTPTSVDNGTMRFAIGSHRGGLFEHGFAGKDAQSIEQGEEILVEIDDTQTVDVVLRAGQFSIHHLALAHCSGPNLTASDRINFTVDYISPQVRPVNGPDSALLVRGGDAEGYYLSERRPLENFGSAELEGYFKAARMRDQQFFSAMQKRSRTLTT